MQSRFAQKNSTILAQPRSRDEMNFIDSQLTSGSFWIGAEPMVNSTPTNFLDGSTIEWIDWLQLQSPKRPVYDCTNFVPFVRDRDQEQSRKWVTFDCESKKNEVICERDVSLPAIKRVVFGLLRKQRDHIRQLETKVKSISNEKSEFVEELNKFEIL